MKIILITDPSKPGSISTAVAATDAIEAEVRKSAAAQGLLAGKAMPLEPTSQFWTFTDVVKRRDEASRRQHLRHS
jgi:hypothetical protein